jgi:hypothetical protein
MAYYSYFFSADVVEKFLTGPASRGWKILQDLTDLDFDKVVDIFQRSQKAWYGFKKACKMAARFSESTYMMERPELLLSNLRKCYKHFYEIYEKECPKGLTPRGVRPTMKEHETTHGQDPGAPISG